MPLSLSAFRNQHASLPNHLPVPSRRTFPFVLEG